MAFWLCILNRENFETIKKEHAWGVAELHKKQLSKAMPGELCAFYLIAEGAGDSRKEPVIGGIAEIVSEPYEDLSEPCVPFKTLIQHLNFITNKKNYSVHLLGKAMREIPTEDMRQILERQS